LFFIPDRELTPRYTRSLHDALPISAGSQDCNNKFAAASILHGTPAIHPIPDFEHAELAVLFGTNPAVSQSSFVHLEGGATIFDRDRKSTRLNSSHVKISYAVFCLKK